MVSLHRSPCNITNSVTLVKVTHNDRKTDRKCCVLKADELKVWWVKTAPRTVGTLWGCLMSWDTNPRHTVPSATTQGVLHVKQQLHERKTRVLHLKRERQLEQNCMCLFFCCFFNRSVYLYYKTVSAVHRRDVIICTYYEEVADWFSKEKKAWQLWGSPTTLESFCENSYNLSTLFL